MMKYFLSSAVIVMAALSMCVHADSSELRFSYWDDATPPFVIERDGKVASGIIKDLANRIVAETGLLVSFVKLPVPRIESQLRAGTIDMDCLTSPIWKESPDEYNWSPVLFEAADRFLVRPELEAKLRDFASLKGLTLGIYHGYVYHPEIMRMIDSGEVKTIKLRGLAHGIQLLQLGRLDALIDFGVLLKYQLRESNLQEAFAVATFPADEYELHCAYSKKMKFPVSEMNRIIKKLVETGEVDKILKRYQ